MDLLRRKRGNIKGKMTRLETAVDDLGIYTATAADLAQIMTWLKRLDGVWTEFCTVQDEVVQHEDANEVDEMMEYADQETRYDRIASQLTAAINFLTTPASPPPAPSTTSSSAPSTTRTGYLKLPKLDLPTFSGAYTDWTSFYDLFNASIHNNATLSSSQKLHYLKSALKGDAAKLLTPVQITDSNYNPARAILESRYANERAIVRAHIHAICSYPACKHESAASLRKLQETVEEHRLALLSHSVDADRWDAILVYIISEKLDPESRKQWEMSSPGNALQTYADLHKFLDERSRALEASPGYKPSATPATTSSKFTTRPHWKDNKSVNSYHAASDQCPCCKDAHRLHRCNKFEAMSLAEKNAFVQKGRLCFNCLQAGHSVGSCPSPFTCRHCKKKHHTVLHKHEDAARNKDTVSASAQVLQAAGSSPNVLLATALVPVRTKDGGSILCRALLDSGSQASFMSEGCAQRLGVTRRRHCQTINGVGNSSTVRTNGSAEIVLLPKRHEPIALTVLVLPKITKDLPASPIDSKDWDQLDRVILADPTFSKPGPIDLLIGADVYDQILLHDKLQQERGSVCLRDTVFGWVISGPVKAKHPPDDVRSFHVIADDDHLRRFWELEELPTASKLTDEEHACEQHFRDTTTRDDSGRFVVRLPFKRDHASLGESRRQADRRFRGLEQRFKSTDGLKAPYSEFIKEFQDLGHLEEVPSDEVAKPDAECYYLPHHCVRKDSSTTTKLRVVFDGSAKTEAGTSLNESLMVGPKIQDDLVNTLLRFRFHRVALSGDITKMYRQVALAPADKDFHRLLWREDPSQPVKHLRMTRVTYGIASSAFHSVRALQELADVEDDPVASPVLRRDFYIDDLLSGESSVERAIELQDCLNATLLKGGFELRKWSSSHPELVNRLPPELRESPDAYVVLDQEYTVKTLGVRWHPLPDSFFFVVHPLDTTTFTKRTLLSDVARLFDPMGWLAPITVKMKCLLQHCWTLGLQWDDPLPDDVQEIWMNWREGLAAIQSLALSRCTLAPSATSDIQLHVFCDASEDAYAACVYSRVEDEQGRVTVKLLVAKTRVAPVKAVSLPRLELCGAHLASKLVTLVVSALDRAGITASAIYAWSDSTVTLAWISDLPRRWTCFVANRVSQIQDVLPPSQWRHVPSADNPADCASRGLHGSLLLEFGLWWNGPPWLASPADQWPVLTPELPKQIPEMKKTAVMAHPAVIPEEHLIKIDRFSRLSRLKRALAYSLRFIHNARHPGDQRGGPLRASEIDVAFTAILRDVQRQQFDHEITRLSSGKELEPSHQLLSLSPFLDEDTRLLKVGGRLYQSDHPEKLKHPVLLLRTSPLARLIVEDAHQSTLHGGAQHTLSHLRQQIWIPGARDFVRRIISQCVRCSRFTSRPPTQIMGDLPEERITPSKPFSRTGLDFGGPLMIKTGKTTGKAYIALFVCFSTKATHLELVSALTTEACLAALRRFVARRGLPHTIYSDNATNFIGARNELLALQHLLSDKDNQKSLANFASSHGIDWVTIPPRAPHFGGLWEAGIKSTKFHLRRIVGTIALTFEELTTILAQIEAILNSRPLVPASSDPNDMQALTPGHFLTGGPLTAVPEATIPTVDPTTVRRWQLVQSLTQHFWRRWHKEYLTTLQQKRKWLREGPKIAVDDLVFIAEDNVPPLQWTYGRITKLFLGNDERPRVAEVKTARTTVIRPVIKLRIIPVAQPSASC